MDQAVQDAINRQINLELNASYHYLAASAHFAAASLDGFALWMRGQSSEELEHAMRLFDYLNERGAGILLDTVKAPPSSFGSPVEVFLQALDHEKAVTASIHAIYALAVEKGDYATQVMLQWFITEQVEEEDTAGAIVDQLKMAGSNEAALLMMDDRLRSRAEG